MNIKVSACVIEVTPASVIFALGATPRETRSIFFFFNDTATPEIYPLSLHDALPISPALAVRLARTEAPAHRPAAASAPRARRRAGSSPCRRRPDRQRPDRLPAARRADPGGQGEDPARDPKSTRLNSSHLGISYAVFC